MCQATFEDADTLSKHQLVHEGDREQGEDLGRGTEQPMEAPTLPASRGAPRHHLNGS